MASDWIAALIDLLSAIMHRGFLGLDLGFPFPLPFFPLSLLSFILVSKAFSV